MVDIWEDFSAISKCFQKKKKRKKLLLGTEFFITYYTLAVI